MTPEDVSRYLATHPEFFDQFPHLLTDMRLNHPVQGRTISIAERQILNLRDKITLLESRLADFVTFGEENDRTTQRMHDLTLALISAPHQDETLSRLTWHLRQHFDLPDSAVLLWPHDTIDIHADDAEIYQWVDNMPTPQCGATLLAQALAHLPSASSLRSFAAIPLRNERLLGVLIVGSLAANKFYPEMGTLYLQRLGDIIAACLARFSLPARAHE